MKHFARILLFSLGLFGAFSAHARVAPAADSLITFEDASGGAGQPVLADGVAVIVRRVEPDVLPAAIPEPATVWMLMGGMLMPGAVTRRRPRR